jgi:hypothetical protein
VNIAFIGATQFLATIAIVFARRDDTPPSPVRPWPPPLPGYEGELRPHHRTETKRPYLPAIDPRKTYNLADLIFSLLDRLLRTQLALAQIRPEQSLTSTH